MNKLSIHSSAACARKKRKIAETTTSEREDRIKKRDVLKCIHRPLQEEDKNKLWFTPGSEEYEAVCKVVEDRFLLKDVRKLSPLYQTAALEAFHSLIVRFCPKHTAFSWLGMYCRLVSALACYCSNPKISVQFPKAKKGEYSIKIIKQEFTYVYLQTLKAELFTKFAEDASALAQSLPQRFQDNPNDIVANYHHPTKEQARATYTRRFSKPEGTKE
ncbi:hypothetical protein ACOMHN_010402 [Nucella lapillus]